MKNFKSSGSAIPFEGRSVELSLLEAHEKTNRAKLVILYGRRRIGKSSLIREFIKNRKALHFEALEEATQKQQIDHFLIQLAEQTKKPKYDCQTWRQVFDILTGIIENEKWILSFDEFPWMASGKTGLVSLLKYYWDQKWKNNPKLMLILCGSVASFMVNHLVHSKAFHNRKTLEMKIDHLKPREVGLFFKKRSLREVACYFMTVGGVPKYLEMFDPEQSPKINFNRNFFTKNGFFVNEFETIFKEQFRTLHYYELIVKALSKKSMSLAELSKAVSFESGGSLKKYLKNLETAGFIAEWNSVFILGPKTKTKKYWLSDPFLRTYFRFIEPNKKIILQNQKNNLVDKIMGENWEGFFGQSFDWLVFQSLDRLLEILEIPLGDVVQFGPYYKQKSRKNKNDPGAQIDLVLLRRDKCVTIVENKFRNNPVGSWVEDELQNKIDRLGFPKDYSIEKVLITASGVTRGVEESQFFSKIITLEDLLK